MSLITNFSEVFAFGLGLNQAQFNNQQIDSIQEKLAQYFEKIKKLTLVRYSEEDYQDSLFAICAWFDEMVLCSNWQDKLQWKKRLLQQKYFNTAKAGEVFFDKLDSIAPGEVDLIEVYFYCLKLGFKGKYYSHENAIFLSEKAKEMYKLIMGKHSIDSDKPLINMTLTPSAVSYNVPINTPFKVKPYKRLSRFIWWLVPLVPLVVVTIVFNEVIQNMAVDYFKSFS